MATEELLQVSCVFIPDVFAESTLPFLISSHDDIKTYWLGGAMMLISTSVICFSVFLTHQ